MSEEEENNASQPKRPQRTAPKSKPKPYQPSKPKK